MNSLRATSLASVQAEVADLQNNWNNLATVATTGSYIDLTNKPVQVNADWNSSAGVSQVLNKPSLATVATSGSYADLTNKPAARSQASASRSLNVAFQVSAIRDANVRYSVDISTSLTLAGGQSGTAYLEISPVSDFSSGTQEIARFVNGNTGAVVVGVSITQNVTSALNGYVPAGYYVRIRTQNNSGTPTFNFRSGQEVLL